MLSLMLVYFKQGKTMKNDTISTFDLTKRLFKPNKAGSMGALPLMVVLSALSACQQQPDIEAQDDQGPELVGTTLRDKELLTAQQQHVVIKDEKDELQVQQEAEDKYVSSSSSKLPDSRIKQDQSKKLITARNESAAGQVSVASRSVADSQAIVKRKPKLAMKKREARSAELKTARRSVYPSTIASNIAPMGLPPQGMPYLLEQTGENYHAFEDNAIKLAGENPVSTFSVDVDTGAYSKVRSMINAGHLPPKAAVRSEEFINYFNYHYDLPESRRQPFSVQTELAPSPWNPGKVLMHIGLQAYDVDRSDLPPSNLVFLVDVSGSMQSENKLGLLKSALRLLSQQMREEDTLSLVVYAGASGVVLNGMKGNDHAAINQALAQLRAGGSTNGGAGIELAYQLAEKHYVKKGINRVLLATDGDFNVGTVNHEALISLIETKRESHISLSTLGFGSGNYNDYLMEQLADKGNGNYAYISNINEARKVLVDEISSTLQTLAKDVKIQIEFNPALVSEYRLIGYENRALKREDFNNDKIDAGEIGAGHTVTAIYELALKGSATAVDPLRYSSKQARSKTDLLEVNKEEIAFVKLRYKAPTGSKSKKISFAVNKHMIKKQLSQSSEAFKFSAAVAAFSQKLRKSPYIGDYSFQSIIDLAILGKGEDKFGYRSEFINMVRTSEAISG